MKLFAKTNLFLALTVSLLAACTCDKETGQCPKEPEYKGYTVDLGNYSPEEFRQIVKDSLGVELKDEHFSVCPCDKNLAFVSHEEIRIEGHGPAQVKTGTGAVGLDIEFAKNFILDIDPLKGGRDESGALIKILQTGSTRQENSNQQNPLVADGGAGAPNTVAVFDAGIPESLSGLSFDNVLGLDANAQGALCKPQIEVPLNSGNRLLGVNHISDAGSTSVDHAAIWDNTENQHGVKVTYLLASQRVGQSGSSPLRILTMRVLNNENKGDLFSLMCAMSQAQQLGAQIFNLSLGYYGAESTMFKRHLEKMKTERGKIWVVVAAGNANATFDNGDIDLPVNRDLNLRPDESKFYPAYFARDLDNVIAVTTIDNTANNVCPMQNYGKKVVDIGVMGDNCGFSYPGSGSNIQGTSYATPVVSGWLARKADVDTYPSKSELLIDAERSTPLQNQVKGGRFIKVNSN